MTGKEWVRLLGRDTYRSLLAYARALERWATIRDDAGSTALHAGAAWEKHGPTREFLRGAGLLGRFEALIVEVMRKRRDRDERRGHDDLVMDLPAYCNVLLRTSYRTEALLKATLRQAGYRWKGMQVAVDWTPLNCRLNQPDTEAPAVYRTQTNTRVIVTGMWLTRVWRRGLAVYKGRVVLDYQRPFYTYLHPVRGGLPVPKRGRLPKEEQR